MEHLLEILKFLSMMCAKVSIPKREGNSLLYCKPAALEILVFLILLFVLGILSSSYERDYGPEIRHV